MCHKKNLKNKKTVIICQIFNLEWILTRSTVSKLIITVLSNFFFLFQVILFFNLGNELIYLDPHTTQLYRDHPEDGTYHCSHPSRMPFSLLDPSIALVCYFHFHLKHWQLNYRQSTNLFVSLKFGYLFLKGILRQQIWLNFKICLRKKKKIVLKLLKKYK